VCRATILNHWFRFAIVSGTLIVAGLVSPASGDPIYRELFSYDTTTPLPDNYPGFTSAFAGTGTVDVTGGVLRLLGSGASSTQSLSRAGFAMPHTLSTLVGSTPGGGGYNVGLVIGGNAVIFHPGHTGAALRVEGPGGFGNQDIGFTPAANVLHQLDVTSDGEGRFDLRLTDGGNPSNVYTASFTNPAAVGATFGVRRSGGAGNGLYDDLQVDVPGVVLFSEIFARDFTLGSGDTAVVGGQLQIAPSNTNYTQAGPTGALTVSGDVSASNSNGSYNVGLVIGQNNIVFHPGLAGGALRVEGPGGFGNQNMGFTPANNVMHHLEVTGDGAGAYTLKLTDGANPANVYTNTFTNAGSLGGAVGFRRSGTSAGLGLFDNLSIAPVGNREFTTRFDSDFAATLAGGTAQVLNGVLRLTGPAGPDTQQTWSVGPIDPPAGASLLISAEIGANTTVAGAYNVGLVIGQNAIVFHPGLAGGALRVEGPGGFSNQDVGFTPANNALHLLQVYEHADGWFQFSLTDRNNPALVYENSFFNPGSVGGAIMFRRNGAPNGPGLYDNLVVQAVPEPLSLALFGLGGLAIVAFTRRRSQPSRCG